MSPKHSRLDCQADTRKRSPPRCAVSAQGRTLVGDREMLVPRSKQEQRLLTAVLLELFKGESH
jgi:hypothetical protein